MTSESKIEKLRTGLMCAVIQLFNTHPEDVLNMFTLDELRHFSEETKPMVDMKLEGVYKDLLDITKP